MSGSLGVPWPVGDDERLSRFIFQRDRIRADGSVKPDAFIPHPWPDLSVTRQLSWTEDDIWKVGREISKTSQRPLHGRTDVIATQFREHRLLVVADPTPDNSHHANVRNWPSEKSAQKAIAQLIAASASKALKPPTGA